jgi:tetratricopeptide (TPR) repeat protein
MVDRFDAALAEAEVAVRINPNLSEAYMSLGTLCGIMRTPAEALAMFRRAYELDPLSPGTAEIVASFASWVGDRGLALDVLTRLRELYPKDPRIYLHIADYHMENKDFDEAAKTLEIARGLDPS